MSLKDEADELAQELFETTTRLRAAGRSLHDHVGPLLSAAGIRLDLLRADFPQAAEGAREALRALDEAMELVRTLSRQLNPPPAAHLGLKKALATLVESRSAAFRGLIHFDYSATAALQEETVAALYQAASAVLARAAGDRTATRLAMTVAGGRALTIKIGSNGRLRWPASALSAIERRACPAGISLDVNTKKGTIVSIRYVPGRPPRG